MTVHADTTSAATSARRPVVHLGSRAGNVTWLGEDLDGIDTIPWSVEAPVTDVATVDGWVAAATEELARRSDLGVHVLAIGAAAYPAIALAARRPELVASLLLGDPQVDLDLDGYQVLLASVTAPTLVIASAPQHEESIEHAQSIAGGIDNGVFVIIDGADVPAHRERGSSFSEWAVAFTEIAEGLRTLHIDDPTHPVSDPKEDSRA
jgi:hypothetical protein